MNLYQELDKLIGDELSVNIESNEGCLYFNLWRYNQWGDHMLYWFPAKFVEFLNPRLQGIAKTFLHDLMKSNDFSTIIQFENYDYYMEMFEESLQEREEEESKHSLALLPSYGKEGDIFNFLRDLETQRPYRNLRAALERYKPQDGRELRLVELMLEGLQFIGKRTPSIMDFAYDPYYESEPDFNPVCLQEQVCFIYDSDTVTEYIQEWLNANSQESYDIVPTTCLALSPKTNRLFDLDPYPDQFMKWADKFLYLIYRML